MSAEQTSPSVLQTPAAKRKFDPRRVLPVLVFVPICYGVVRYAPPVVFFGLVCASALLALRELYRLHFKPEPAWLETAAGMTAAVLLLFSMQWPQVLPERAALAVALVALPVLRLCSLRALRDSLGDLAMLFFGLLYVGFMLGHLLPLRALPDGIFLVFFVLLVTWAGDTGAYVTGLNFGAHPLAPTISPKKTVEGLIGGVFLAMLAALLAQVWFLPAFSLPEAAALGLGLGLIGAMGDLAESALKRSAGVKDSGSLIPAHGGMLDRIDSLLFTIPALYYYLVLVHA